MRGPKLENLCGLREALCVSNALDVCSERSRVNARRAAYNEVSVADEGERGNKIPSNGRPADGVADYGKRFA